MDRECRPIVAHTVAPNLLRRMHSVAWPNGRRTSQGVSASFFFCFLRFFFYQGFFFLPDVFSCQPFEVLHSFFVLCQKQSCCATQTSSVASMCPEDLCSSRVEFQRNGSENNTPIFIWCLTPAWLISTKFLALKNLTFVRVQVVPCFTLMAVPLHLVWRETQTMKWRKPTRRKSTRKV